MITKQCRTCFKFTKIDSYQYTEKKKREKFSDLKVHSYHDSPSVTCCSATRIRLNRTETAMHGNSWGDMWLYACERHYNHTSGTVYQNSSNLSSLVLQREKLFSFLDCVQMCSRTNKVPNNIYCKGDFLNLNMYSNTLNQSEKTVDKEN